MRWVTSKDVIAKVLPWVGPLQYVLLACSCVHTNGRSTYVHARKIPWRPSLPIWPVMCLGFPNRTPGHDLPAAGVQEPAAASVRRSALELALQQGMDWADVDALLDTAAARMGQGDRMLRGAHAEARAAVTRAAFRRGRAALAAASQEDSGAGEGEGGEGDAGSGAGGDGGSTEGEAEGGEGEDAEEEEHEEVQEEEGAAEEEQGEEEGAPAEEDGEGQQGPRHVLHNGAIPGVQGRVGTKECVPRVGEIVAVRCNS